MPQVVGKSPAATNLVQGSKRQTYNSTKGEVLLICDEDSLSDAQKHLYSEHEDRMKAYQKALEAYNKQYGKLDTTNVQATATSTQRPPHLSCKGNGVLENGVATPQPQSLPQQQQLQQQQPQANVLIPIGTPIKKAALPQSWQQQMQTTLVNKVAMPGTISIPSNMVTTQQVPNVINPVNSSVPKTVIQVPVGTDLTGMQVVNVPGSTGNYQLVVSPQVAYPAFNSSVAPRSEVPVRLPNVVPAPVQKILVPLSTSTRVTVPNAILTTKPANTTLSTTASTVASIQAVSVTKTTKTAEQVPVSSPAVNAKRSAPADGDKTNSKRSKRAATSVPSQPDVEDNYYGWKQGRLWWDDEKPRGSFRCYVCNKKLPTNIRYMQHVKHHLDKEQQQNSTLNNLISCRSCYKHFSSASALQHHVEKAHKYCAHRCSICELACDDGPSLLDHLSKNHKSLQMPYVCGVCSYASSIYDDLILHFNKHHEGSKALMCPFCVRIIRCNNAFLRHCKTHLTVSIKNGLFRCRSCKLMFLNNSMLKEHLQEDHKLHPLQERNGVPQLQSIKGKQIQAASVQKVSFPMQTGIKISPSLWTRREIIKPRGHLRCFECGIMTDVCREHFRKKMSCNRCKYTTYCGTAFANHMIVFHKAGSTPKIHHIRKTIVNNGRILLGCRNCEFSSLSPTLMACHIESCPRGALIIESFKVRTNSLQSSRHYKREVVPVTVKAPQKANMNKDEDDDDVIVIEEEVLVDLTDDAPSTSKEEKDSPKPKPEESTGGESLPKKVSSLTIKLEKLPDDLVSKKLVKVDDVKGDNEQSSKDAIDNNKPASDDEKMEVDEPANVDGSSDGTVQKTLHGNTQNSGKDAEEPVEIASEGKESVGNANDHEQSSEDKIEASDDSGSVIQTNELAIKREQIDAHE